MGSKAGNLHTLLALALLSLAARALYLYDASDYPAFFAPIVDADRYDALAQALANGRDVGRELYWQPAFYPVLLGLIYRVVPGSTEHAILAVKIVQALLGAATVLVVWRLGVRAFGARAGVVAGCIFALYGPALFFEGELLGTGWEMFWAAALPGLLAACAERARPLRYAAFGAGSALAILARPSFVPCVVVGVAWLAWRAWRARESSPRAAQTRNWSALVAAASLILVPALVTRHAATNQLSLLPLSGGINLYVGNNPDRCRTLAARPGSEWQAIANEAEAAGAGRDPVAQDAYFYARFTGYVAGDPLGFSAGILAKAQQLISGRELPRNEDVYSVRPWSSWLGLLVQDWGFPFGVLLPLALLGAWHERRSLPVPLLLFLVSYAGSVVLVFVSARHRMPLVPPLCVLAAAGALALCARREPRALGLCWATLAGLVALCTLPRDPCGATRLSPADLYFAVASHHLAREHFAQALPALERTLELEPNRAEAELAAFYAYLQRGDVAAAERHLSRYVTLAPEDERGRRLLEGVHGLR
jgi:4-amino-4-deoxy-L-arabinose transferase-like glycosyltransferase